MGHCTNFTKQAYTKLVTRPLGRVHACCTCIITMITAIYCNTERHHIIHSQEKVERGEGCCLSGVLEEFLATERVCPLAAPGWQRGLHAESAAGRWNHLMPERLTKLS